MFIKPDKVDADDEIIVISQSQKTHVISRDLAQAVLDACFAEGIKLEYNILSGFEFIDKTNADPDYPEYCDRANEIATQIVGSNYRDITPLGKKQIPFHIANCFVI
jgi:hypothetical protein